MKHLTIILLAVSLLVAPAAGKSNACRCKTGKAAPAVCIDESSGGSELGRPVTLEFREGSNRQLSVELSRIVGREISFSPSKPEEAISLDVKNAALWDVLETLSQSGKVQVGTHDFSELESLRNALASGQRVSACIEGVTVERAVSELSGLSGQAMRITSGDAKAFVTLSVKGISLAGIVRRMATQTGVQITMK